MDSILIIVVLMKLLDSVFLFPIKDRRERERGFPWMTASLVVINVLIHIWIEITIYARPPASPEEPYWLPIYPFMEVAGATLKGEGLGALSSLTSFFLHADWSHLVGNMFFLWFFGRKVEDATGPLRFCFLYFLCGFSASFVSVLARATLSPIHGQIPGLGASGAISGLMGAYLFLYSDQRIMTLVSSWLNRLIAGLGGAFCFVALPIPIWLPAWVFLLYNFLRDALLAQLTVEAMKIGIPLFGVNVFAHLGGAFGGLFFIYFFVHPEVLARRR
jgi:membrane associated rhomboid family serine protease